MSLLYVSVCNKDATYLLTYKINYFSVNFPTVTEILLAIYVTLGF